MVTSRRPNKGKQALNPKKTSQKKGTKGVLVAQKSTKQAAPASRNKHSRDVLVVTRSKRKESRKRDRSSDSSDMESPPRKTRKRDRRHTSTESSDIESPPRKIRKNKKKHSKRRNKRRYSSSDTERSHKKKQSKRKTSKKSSRRCQDTSSSSEEYSSDWTSTSDDSLTPLEFKVKRTPGSIPTVPRTTHVRGKMRRKIRRGEYVKMRDLLFMSDDEDENDKKKKEKNDKNDKNYNPTRLSFFNWTQCFHTFMSIRLQHAPHEVQGMLRHAEIVSDLQRQGRDGLHYDVKFRKIKQNFPEIKFGEYLNELVNSAKTLKSKASGNFRPRAACFKFNSVNGCFDKECKYLHKCSNCSRTGHPVQRCYSDKRPRH